MNSRLRIAGTGCCLVDRIYPEIDFRSPGLAPFLSQKKGDGGITPGHLVFAEQFEVFARLSLEECIRKITAGSHRPVRNIGGPSIVSLIHAAQLLAESEVEVSFHGVCGADENGQFLQNALQSLPLKLGHFQTTNASTPSTIVLSDPSYESQGERAFINDIGAAWDMGPGDLGASFFEADIAVFGGTALVPGIHDALPKLLARAKDSGCLTLVNTVYDFRSEMTNPEAPWTLGGPEAWPLIDLLICDRDEALHLSGSNSLEESAAFFMDSGAGAFLITNGSLPGMAWSKGAVFQATELATFPISRALSEELITFKDGDTTGCGDNFAGGVLASLAWQLLESRKPNLTECLAWGSISGSSACFQVGGCSPETERGEKLARLLPYYHKYIRQIND